MSEELETVLRLVAEGALSPEEASPIIEALTRAERQEPSPADARDRSARRMDRVQRRIERAYHRADEAIAQAEERAAQAGFGMPSERGRQLRIRVTERGRQVVNLRIPIGFVDAALQFVPGLAGDQSQRIRDAVQSGATGPILDVEDPDGDGVLISVE